jgi:hypothetical protein
MTDFDDTTGLPSEDWHVDRHEGLITAIWKQESAYQIKETEKGSWTLEEKGEALGEFETALAAAEAMPKLDFDPWEDLDGRNEEFYVKLAATDFEEWTSDETQNVFLRRELGSWWLSEPGVSGQSEYPTRLRGQIAGLELYSKSYEVEHEKVIKSLDLDDQDWRVVIDQGHITGTNVHDESITIEATSGSRKWALFNGEDMVGDYRSAKDAAAAAPRPGPTL